MDCKIINYYCISPGISIDKLEQDTATSCEWKQSSIPNPLCVHDESMISDEVHWRLSSQVIPEP